MEKPRCCYISLEACQVLKHAPNMSATDVLGHIDSKSCQKLAKWTVYPDPNKDPYRYYTSCDDHLVDFLNDKDRTSVLPIRSSVEVADDRTTAEG